MTSTEPRIESIEHLEFEPQCTECDHTAQLWVDVHGCEEGFRCAKCVEADRRDFYDAANEDGRVYCTTCKESFTLYQDAVTVRPL